eukprot:766921-Hanusia_phi.AAC.4
MGEGAESDKLREDDVMESEVALRCMTLVAYQYAKHVSDRRLFSSLPYKPVRSASKVSMVMLLCN